MYPADFSVHNGTLIAIALILAIVCMVIWLIFHFR